MPLSEHEERILAEIERQLAEEDPRFVARTRGRRSWSRVARVRLTVALGIVGVVCLFSLVFSIVFGALGMALLFTAIVMAIGLARDGETAMSPGADDHH